MRLSSRISNSMEAVFCVDCLEEALRLHGKPEVFNSDQGSQFTSEAFIGVLKREGITISMDGRWRAFDLHLCRAVVAQRQVRGRVPEQLRHDGRIADWTDEILCLLQRRADDLQKLIRDTDSNVSWINALSSVNGVYLKYKKDGRLYVGSAYGKGGILGRWSGYAKSGHAGNKLLKDLDPVVAAVKLTQGSISRRHQQMGVWKNLWRGSKVPFLGNTDNV